MIKKCIFLIITTALLFTLTACEGSEFAAPEGRNGGLTPKAEVILDEHVYQLFDVTMTWEGAQSYCKSIQGHLVSITSEKEQEAVEKVCKIFQSLGVVSSTACRYCTEVCPQGIPIPATFACLNAKKIFNDPNAAYYYREIHTQDGNKASDCLKCGVCEDICPQHLEIRELLEKVVEVFEQKEQ